jgi:hypothetical protein
MADDEVLAREYERNMRSVRNDAKIDAAKMMAEKANAELMVAVKADANMATDLTEFLAKKTALTAKFNAESDATKKATLTASIADINEAKTRITDERVKAAAAIKKLTAAVSKADADALTIEAEIAAGDAEADLREAAEQSAAVDGHIEDLEAQAGNIEVEMALATDEVEKERLKAALVDLTTALEATKKVKQESEDVVD